ncbi:unnamed protein product [Thlaspi arvense]|uniref:RNase H type-1 domain-containing protein n=1 Tax=Thlaspi arvense TaxID=13288 RepID=A0AAU9TBQ8_THLAR|nr:unnamed protein product [Thlaspi arvense]
MVLVIKASSEPQSWQAANIAKEPKYSQDSKPKEVPVTPTITTCCTHGAWNPESRNGGMGWVISNPEGATIRESSSARRFVSSALRVEVLAILSALREAISLEIKDMHIQSDSEVLINVITKGSELIEIAGILDDIWSIVPLFTSIFFSFINRSANILVDGLAKSVIFSLGPMGHA